MRPINITNRIAKVSILKYCYMHTLVYNVSYNNVAQILACRLWYSSIVLVVQRFRLHEVNPRYYLYNAFYTGNPYHPSHLRSWLKILILSISMQRQTRMNMLVFQIGLIGSCEFDR